MNLPIRRIMNKTGYGLISLWLVFHVLSVFLSPASMEPSSPLLIRGHRLTEPYSAVLFLNHGYHYFAPDPGSSTLIGYSMTRDGDTAISGRIPDPAIFPRLLYHRYFMLAENIWAFPEPTQKAMLEAYARHFARQSGTGRVALSRISHQPSSIARIQAGGLLSDSETFVEEPLGVFDFADHSASPAPDSTNTPATSNEPNALNAPDTSAPLVFPAARAGD